MIGPAALLTAVWALVKVTGYVSHTEGWQAGYRQAFAEQQDHVVNLEAALGEAYAERAAAVSARDN